MNEIQATAPTPQDWVELVRENERLTKRLDMANENLDAYSHAANHWYEKYESKAAECQEAYAEIGVLKGESE